MKKILVLFLILFAFVCSPVFAANQVLRDSRGLRIGMIKTMNNREYIYDSQGHMLGYFDGRYTYDSRGHKIGEGNFLTSLLR